MTWSVVEANSLDYLSSLDSNSVDALIMDPPSGTGMMLPFQDQLAVDRYLKFDSPLGKLRYNYATLHTFNLKCRQWFDQEVSSVIKASARVLKPGGVAVVWCMPRNQHWVADALEAGGLDVTDVIQRLRHRQRPKSPLVDGVYSTQLVQELEPWVLARKPGESTARETYKKWGVGYLHVGGDAQRASHLVTGFEGVDRDSRHPTSKPVAWMRYLVRMCSPVDGLVLDPFCGSGSTGVAALLERRRFVGVERESLYVEQAKQRLRDAEIEMQSPLWG